MAQDTVTPRAFNFYLHGAPGTNRFSLGPNIAQGAAPGAAPGAPPPQASAVTPGAPPPQTSAMIPAVPPTRPK